MPFNYTDRAACITRIFQRTGLDANNVNLSAEVGYKLDDSAGLVDIVTYYRPLYVAAVMLMQSRDDQTVTSADGASFFGSNRQWNLQPTIESLLREQDALDRRLDIEVPEGYGVTALLDALCGCESGGESSSPDVMSILNA